MISLKVETSLFSDQFHLKSVRFELVHDLIKSSNQFTLATKNETERFDRKTKNAISMEHGFDGFDGKCQDFDGFDGKCAIIL